MICASTPCSPTINTCIIKFEKHIVARVLKSIEMIYTMTCRQIEQCTSKRHFQRYGSDMLKSTIFIFHCTNTTTLNIVAGSRLVKIIFILLRIFTCSSLNNFFEHVQKSSTKPDLFLVFVPTPYFSILTVMAMERLHNIHNN